MNFLLKISLVFVLGFMLSSFASNDEPQNQKPIYHYKGFLGCSLSDSVSLSKEEFTKLISVALCAKDTNNVSFAVKSYEITYVERGLYQDSTGLPIIVPEYTNRVCKGDSVPQQWQNEFKERGYKSDTVFFEKIILIGSDNKLHPAKTIKVVIK